MFKLFLIGCLLAVGNNLLLKQTIKKLLQHKKILLVVISFFARMTILAIVFYIFFDKKILNAVCLLVGITITNFVFMGVKMYKKRK